MEKLDFQNKINFNERPFNISNKLLLGAGPVNCSLRVLKALSLPALAPISGEMYKVSRTFDYFLQLCLNNAYI